MNRIERAFKLLNKTNSKAFVPYMMAGDGGLDCLVDRLILLEKFGASAIEVGVPFSDPVADGPTIQRAGMRALQNGTTLRGIIEELEKARKQVSIPIILMTYLNPIYAFGIDRFVEAINNAGIDGCIIPDLPLEEEEMIAPKLSEVGVELIRLVTPTTPVERIKQISSKGNGFLYAVTIKGITGTRIDMDKELYSFLNVVKSFSPLPVLAGFGIDNHDQIMELSNYCDGVVVGSKIVELFNENKMDELKQLLSINKKMSQLT
ncbi:tryptophan synthase subunit alpha [Neobacillus thermocopriae]|uniref:tryptophan synthase subunit alpha n=1 Tax=Neobacillus thermocopriae TaxID=1215031 RepID=UPI002E1E697C|nr:tryptophan synthase subunit alpha [Neobacillus thermocopriae]MED3625433.1 tryptophan synthase subunit alpha [Neobacillus thermocopriae]MED3714650.1 tryptophan synthase subunit alpha [Neobacillus thermocopriae]